MNVANMTRLAAIQHARAEKMGEGDPAVGEANIAPEDRIARLNDTLARISALEAELSGAQPAERKAAPPPPAPAAAPGAPAAGQERKMPKALMVARAPASTEAEHFRALRAQLLTAKGGEPVRLFAIASHASGDAADYVAMNLAASFAQLNRRTLIVDADVRAGRLAARFGLGEAPGLCHVLAGEIDFEAACQPSVIDDLVLLPSGGGGPGAEELLADGGMPEALAMARASFDNVIVLAAPYGPTADGHYVWAAARSVLVVARRHHDRLEELRRLNIALRHVGAEVIGATLLK